MAPLLSYLPKFRAVLTSAQRRKGLALLALMVLGMALEMLCTSLVIPAIALMTQQDLAASYPQLQRLAAALGGPTQTELVLMSMAALVGVYAAKNLFLAFLAWRQTRFVYDVQADLSLRLFTLYLRQPYAFHLQRNSAQLVRNVTSETALFAETLLYSLNVATELLVLAGISALLLVIEPVGAMLAVGVLGASGWVFQRTVRKWITRWGEKRQQHEGQRLQHLYQGLGGAKDVKLLGREAEFLAQYETHNAQSARVAQHQAALLHVPRLALEILAVGGLATLVLAMVGQGKGMASIAPTLGLFAAAAFRLMPSVNRILNSLNGIRYCAPAVSTVHEELKLAAGLPSAEPRRAAAQRARFNSEIRMTGLAYTYPGAATPALNGVDMTVRKGEAVGFLGASGAGKSTLVDVLLGLFAPSAGVVSVDGRNIADHLRAWQDQIGYVPQSIYLTDDTVRRNVAFGLATDEIDDAAVERALRAAQLHDFVASLPEGAETVVGEKGVRLSGGQRQRIGIARALYHNPAVLVLDEATSALDTATERGVMQAVAALHGSKTIVIVAHRLSTVEQCDRLYQLERGRVVAEGTPAELLRIPRAV